MVTTAGVSILAQHCRKLEIAKYFPRDSDLQALPSHEVLNVSVLITTFRMAV